MKYNFKVSKDESSIENYEEKQIYHENYWGQLLEKTFKCKRIIIEIIDITEKTVGHIVLFRKSFLFFEIIGSPIKGTMTGPMGILLSNPDHDRKLIYFELS